MGGYTMFNRRDFIRNGLLFSSGALIPAYSMAEILKQRVVKLVVLHTNDWHSRIDPFPESDPKFPGQGGFSRRAAYVEQVRNEEEHILLLDAGDIFQGTPYFNFYEGELEFKLMSYLKYDAATFGNHDFDNGVNGLLKQWKHANFPFINANYDFTNSDLNGKVLPYKIFKKGPLKIGVFGVGIELEGLVPKNNFEGIVYHDPVAKANEIAARLKNDYNCHLVICLSHLGYKYDNHKVSDRVLAAENEHIDLIIGGHTHTFMERPEKVLNKLGKITLVTQMGWAGLKIGRLTYEFSEKSGNLVVMLVQNENF